MAADRHELDANLDKRPTAWYFQDTGGIQFDEGKLMDELDEIGVPDFEALTRILTPPKKAKKKGRRERG